MDLLHRGHFVGGGHALRLVFECIELEEIKRTRLDAKRHGSMHAYHAAS